MSPESLIYLIILVIAIGVLAYVIVHFLTKAGAPSIAISGVWVIAALIVLLILLRQVGGWRVGALEFEVIRSLLA